MGKFLFIYLLDYLYLTVKVEESRENIEFRKSGLNQIFLCCLILVTVLTKN